MSTPTEQEVTYDFVVSARETVEWIVHKAHEEAQRVLGDDYTLDTVDVHSGINGLSADCTATALIQLNKT